MKTSFKDNPQLDDRYEMLIKHLPISEIHRITNVYPKLYNHEIVDDLLAPERTLYNKYLSSELAVAA